MNKCPDENTLADYTAGGLSLSDSADIEKHISGCKICLAKISIALKAGALYKEGKLPSVPQAVTERTKEMLAEQIKPQSAKHAKNQNLWLLAALAAFIMSFVFPRYFLQCLVATILLGIKWIAESEKMRTLILVLDSWRRHEHTHDEEISQRLKDRGNIHVNDK